MSKLVTIKNDNGETDVIGISTDVVQQLGKSTLILGNEMIHIEFESHEIISIQHEPE